MPDVPPELLARASRAACLDTAIRSAPPEWNAHPGEGFVEQSAGAFAARSGRLSQQVYRAILFGFISGYVRLASTGRRLRWTVRLSHADETMDDVMDRLDALAPPLATVEHRRWYNDARLSCSRQTREVPAHWIESLAALREFDGDKQTYEISALIACERDELGRVSRTMEALRSGLVRTPQAIPIEGDVRKALRDALDLTVPELTNTCLDPLAGEDYEAPSPRHAARLLAIDQGFRSLAIAVMADALANAELATYDRIAPAMQRLAVVLGRAPRGDTREIRRRIKAYLADRILPDVRPWVKLRDVFELLAAERRMGEWAADPATSGELKAWLNTNRPAVPRDKTFFDMLKNVGEKLDCGAIERRRRRADYIADNFDGLLVEIAAVTADAKAIWQATLSAHRAYGGSGAEKFAVELKARDEGYGDTGSSFLLDLTTISVREQLESIDPLIRKRGGKTPTFTQAALEGRGPYADGAFIRERVAVIKRSELLSAIEANPQLAFLEPYAHGCTLTGRHLPDAVLQDRRDYFVATGTPGPRLAPAGVIVGESEEMRKLMTWSLAYLDEVVLPVTSLYRGLAIAHFNYRLSSVGHVRVSTGRQAIDDLVRGWTTLGGRPALLAIPKLPHAMRILPRSRKIRAHPVDGPTMSAFADAIAITIHVEGGDPQQPKRLRKARVPAHLHMPKECGDDRYVSQAGGFMMSISNIRYCISFAFGREVQTHDPRHGGATKRVDEGDSLKDVGRAIGTRSHVVDRYAKRGKGKADPQAAGRWLRTRDGMARLGSERGRK